MSMHPTKSKYLQHVENWYESPGFKTNLALFRGIVSLHLSAVPLSENIIQRYGSLPGVLHMIELEKGKTGLGLSLAGNRDRSRMSVFVVGIDPNGAAGRDGRMVVGDELLEVNSSKFNSSKQICQDIELFIVI